MNSPTKDKTKQPSHDAGPQGTVVFSAEEIEAALEEKSNVTVLFGDNESFLVGVNGDFESHVFHLTKHAQTIGRKADSDIMLDSPSVSSLHAKIVRDEDNWKVVNLLSSNGTFVNGNKVSVCELKDGDILHFGQLEFMFKSSGVDSQQDDTAKATFTPLIVTSLIVATILLATAYWLY